MDGWLQYEGGVSWCESRYAKYEMLPFVAEFWNSATALALIVLPLLNLFALKEYFRAESPISAAPHLIIVFNGIASTYYHATLSVMGQVIDEISLVWLINISIAANLPSLKSFPVNFRQHLNRVRWSIVLVTLFVSTLCLIRPSLNAFALMTVSIPFGMLIYYEGTQEETPGAKELTSRIIGLWIAASACWIADKFLCDVWLYIGFPYLHAIFHLLSSLSGYYALILCAVMDVNRRGPSTEYRARIGYLRTARLSTLPPLNFPYLVLRRKGDVAPLE